MDKSRSKYFSAVLYITLILKSNALLNFGYHCISVNNIWSIARAIKLQIKSRILKNFDENCIKNQDQDLGSYVLKTFPHKYSVSKSKRSQRSLCLPGLENIWKYLLEKVWGLQ